MVMVGTNGILKLTIQGRHDRIILLTERKTCQQKEQKKEETDSMASLLC